MIRVRVRVPAWALAAGMPAPADDESFDTYWRRAGATDETIEMATAGLNDRSADVANERMTTYLIRTMPRAFDRHVEMLNGRGRQPTRAL
jgi:hypothetical protein